MKFTPSPHRLIAHRLPLIAVIFLSSCVVPTLQTQPRQSSQAHSTPSSVAPSSSAPSSQSPTAEGDVVTPPLTTTGSSIQQRLLTGGLLEIGNPTAPVTLLVFTNPYCRYCQEFQTNDLPRLIADEVTPGTLRIVTVPFPLKKYKESESAALSLICAALQGKGLETSDLLFTAGLSSTEERKRTALLGLNTRQMLGCMKSAEALHALQIQKGMADALAVTLLPTFFVNGQRTVGLPEYSDLKGSIENEKLRVENGK